MSITVEDAAREILQRLAQAQRKGLVDVVLNALTGLAASSGQTVPAPEDRRRVLDRLWERVDACIVEVGERPTRAQTYDHRRFHRY